MVQDDPSKRPTIDEVVERYDAIRRSLSWWTLRSRIQYVDEDEFLFLSSFRAIKHLFHTSIHLLTFRSAVPTPYH